MVVGYFLSKSLYYNYLAINSKVVSKIVYLFFLYIYYIIYYIYYLLLYSYYLTIYYYIPLYINTLRVGSNLIFCQNHPTTLLYYWYWKILYVNVTIYTNIDILINIIYKCNNFNKPYILKNLIYRTYIHAHDI